MRKLENRSNAAINTELSVSWLYSGIYGADSSAEMKFVRV